MAQALSLLDFLRGLRNDDAFRSAFTADPGATLAEHGLGDLSPYDVHDALVLMEDTETAEFSPDFTSAGAHLTPPPPDGSSDAHQYLSAYLDPDADIEPRFASGSADSGGYATGADDTIAFGEGAATVTGGIDDDPEPAYGLDGGAQPTAEGDVDLGAPADDAAEFPATPEHADDPHADRFAPADHADGEHHAPIV
ncbi:IniB N-terminal domain-containing protein [Pseudonocardia xinjiangensis]|uniref:IniB N-terminal domain-containing protein n=1 Tax=Pseudonocardia xinjiangensis TaxID=75289 RepID=UPI003D93EE00